MYESRTYHTQTKKYQALKSINCAKSVTPDICQIPSRMQSKKKCHLESIQREDTEAILGRQVLESIVCDNRRKLGEDACDENDGDIDKARNMGEEDVSNTRDGGGAALLENPHFRTGEVKKKAELRFIFTDANLRIRLIRMFIKSSRPESEKEREPYYWSKDNRGQMKSSMTA